MVKEKKEKETEVEKLIKSEVPTAEEMGIAEKEKEKKVVDVVNDCKIYRGVFILKTELIRKLEEAFPEK